MKGQEGENDGTSAEGIHALRAKILEVLRQEPYMGEKIPVRWSMMDNDISTRDVHLIFSQLIFMLFPPIELAK